MKYIPETHKTYNLTVLFSGGTAVPRMDFKLDGFDVEDFIRRLEQKRIPHSPDIYQIIGQTDGITQIIGFDLDRVSQYILSEIPTILTPSPN